MKRVFAFMICCVVVEQTVHTMGYEHFNNTDLEYRHNRNPGISPNRGYRSDQNINLERNKFNQNKNYQRQIFIVQKNLPELEKNLLLQKQLENIYKDVKRFIKELQTVNNNKDLNFIKQSFKFCINGIKILLENNLNNVKNLEKSQTSPLLPPNLNLNQRMN